MPFVPKERCSPPSGAVSQVMAALHQAKQELALEMEANLKQLKSILEETQTISKEMEAVLKELKGENTGAQNASGQANNAQVSAWSPPAAALAGAGQNQQRQQQQQQQNQQNPQQQQSQQSQQNSQQQQQQQSQQDQGDQGTWSQQKDYICWDDGWNPPPLKSGDTQQKSGWQPPPDAWSGYDW